MDWINQGNEEEPEAAGCSGDPGIRVSEVPEQATSSEPDIQLALATDVGHPD